MKGLGGFGGFRFPGNFDDDFGDFDDFGDEDDAEFRDFLRRQMGENKMELKEDKENLRMAKKVYEIFKERSSLCKQQQDLMDEFKVTDSVDELVTLYNRAKELNTESKKLWSSNYEFIMKHDDDMTDDIFIERGLALEELLELIQQSLLLRMAVIFNEQARKEMAKKSKKKQEK